MIKKFQLQFRAIPNSTYFPLLASTKLIGSLVASSSSTLNSAAQGMQGA